MLGVQQWSCFVICFLAYRGVGAFSYLVVVHSSFCWMFQFEVWLTLEFVCCPGLGLYLSSHESGVPTSSQINGDWSSGQTAIMFLCTFWCAAYTRAKACCLPVVTADDSASVMQWWPAILEDETSRRRDDGIFHVLDGRLGLSLNLYPHASAGDRICLLQHVFWTSCLGAAALAFSYKG